jgi:hypothetical protein
MLGSICGQFPTSRPVPSMVAPCWLYEATSKADTSSEHPACESGTTWPCCLVNHPRQPQPRHCAYEQLQHPTPTRSVSEVGKQHRALRWSQPLGILEFGHVLMCVSRYSSINNHNQIAWIGICSHRNIAWMLTMLRPLWKGHLTTGRVWSSKQAYRIHF